MARRTAAIACVLCCHALIPGSAAAQNGSARGVPNTVDVVLPDNCNPAPFDIETFLKVLRLELASHDIEFATQEAKQSADRHNASRVSIDLPSCTMRKGAELEVRHLGTAMTAQRSLVLSVDGRNRRARVLALATVEFLLLKWPELESPRKEELHGLDGLHARLSTQERELQALRDKLSERAPARGVPLQRLVLGVSGTANLFIEYPSAALGVGAWVSVRIARALRLRFDAGGAFGRDKTPLGRIKIRTAQVSAAALVGGGRNVWVGLGPRVQIGWATLRGEAIDNVTLDVIEDTQSGITGSVGALLSVSIPVGDRWSLGADAHLGFGFHRIEARADSLNRAGVGGATAGFGVRIGYGFE